MAETRVPGPAGYSKLLGDLKQRIQAAQLRASLAVNRELVFLYWQIGRDILARQERENWGAKVIDRLAGDLKAAFPEMKGFSPRNLKYMRAFAEAWPEEAIVQQLVAQIPWGHNVRILDYVKDPIEREWYVRATVQHGWSFGSATRLPPGQQESRRLSAVAWRQPSSRPSGQPSPALSSQRLSWRRVPVGPWPPWQLRL